MKIGPSGKTLFYHSRIAALLAAFARLPRAIAKAGAAG
jgi:hypothetical protein